MFCSGCGQPVAPNQASCPQCGRPIPTPVPAVPGFEYQLQNYAGKVKALGIVWYIYAAFSLVTGFFALTVARAFFAGHFGPWMHGPWGNAPFPPIFGPAMIHFVWVMLLIRSLLAFIAGWGLMERAAWGRIVAIVAAFLNILKFPFGTALGIWTLVVLLGYRNTKLYEEL